MSNMHPIFTDIVKSFQDAAASAAAASKDVYILMLKTHDWQFEYTDDGRVYGQGADERNTLHMIQKEIDADFEIWNFHVPFAYRKGSPDAAIIARRMKELM